MVWVLYKFIHVVFCIRSLKIDGLNIEDILPNLDNVNYIKKINNII